MSDQCQELLAAILKLPEKEQEYIALNLLDVLPFPEDIWAIDEDGFDAEIERRAADSSSGISWEELRDRA